MSSEAGVVAVTGASGLIGSRVVAHLVEAGWKVRTLSRRPVPGSADAIEGDVRQDADVARLLEGSSCVVHLAGVAHTTLSTLEAEQEAERINVGGTARVFDWAKRLGVSRVLLASSAHAYAGQAGTGLREDSKVAADSFYARTKLEVERMGREAAAQNGLEVVVVRPCLTYGPGARFNLQALMRAIRGGYYFHIRGHDPLRSFLSVDNAAAAIAHLLRHGADRGVYNLADREPQRLNAFTDHLADGLQARRPRSMPLLALRAAAAVGSKIEFVGRRSPITAESIRKLTTPFSLDVSALAQTGFEWRGDELETMHRMAAAFLRERPAK